jgi:AcrR family transcriptional regulator
MTSLREKQRERRRHEIMEAAWQLFGEKGVDGTSIEEIASRAEVGPATVYNYFGAKTDLLEALFVRYIEQEVEAGQVAVDNPPGRMADGMFALFVGYLERALSSCSPMLMREFYMLSMSKQFDYGRRTYQLKQRFMGQAMELATYYKERGQIREEVPAQDAALVCYSVVTFPFFALFLGLGADVESARQQLRRYLELAIDGLGPRDSLSGEARHDA